LTERLSAATDALHERDTEVAVLADALAAARTAGALVVIEGPPGIGKTRLVAAAREHGRSEGFLTLSARASELEVGVPFGVVRQLLDPLVLGADPGERARLFEGAAAGAESVFMGAAADDASEDAFPKLHGLFWLLSDLAQRRPLLLLVDDAHWGDAGSLQLLAFLAPRLDDVAIAVVVATRPVGETGNALLARIRTDPAASVVTPTPLSVDAVRELAAGSLAADPDPSFVSACADATGGNPFFVSELLREISARRLAPDASSAAEVGTIAPGGVAAMVMLRLSSAPEGARELAEAVAVLGTSATLADAAELASLDAERARAGAAALIEVGILTDEPELGFVHPVVRTAVESGVPAAARATAHARAADVLRRRGAPVEDIAAHLLLAPPSGDAEAVAVLRDAAARALALGLPASAVPLLSRALAEPPPRDDEAELLIELGRAHAAAGQPSAEPTLRRAIEAAGDPSTHARAAIELARTAKYGGGAGDAVPLLEARLHEVDDPVLNELLEVELLCLASVSAAARDALRDRLAAIREPDADATGPAAAHAWAALAFEAGASGRSAADGAAYAARVPRALRGTDDSPADWIMLMTMAAATWCEAYEIAEHLSDLLISRARERGTALPLAGAASLRALLNVARGRMADAAVDATFALDLARQTHGTDVLVMLAKNTLALEAIDRGAPEGELRERLRLLEGDRPDFLPFGEVLTARGLVLLALGDTTAALDALRGAGAVAEQWAPGPAVVPWRGPTAVTLHRLGELQEARAVADEDLERSRAFGAPKALGRALRTTALVGDDKDRLERLEESVVVLEDGPDPLELARALLDLGVTLRLGRRPTDARDPLRRAAELAVRAGADGLAARAHDELLASGARPRRVALSGVEALTPSERRVAELAAAGRSNREIAQELYVTLKTVEGHLRHAYDKLGIRSRLGLAEALAG
jgi:DNA-binding CsgD family transcriptional regulator/tetratricopeptide (TPR) repeat protein